jgi:hypothetical protein
MNLLKMQNCDEQQLQNHSSVHVTIAVLYGVQQVELMVDHC